MPCVRPPSKLSIAIPVYPDEVRKNEICGHEGSEVNKSLKPRCPEKFGKTYREVSNIRRFSSHPVVVFTQFVEARCSVENDDVVGAAPTGDAPTTSEWSTI